jgi:hypothetical protein
LPRILAHQLRVLGWKQRHVRLTILRHEGIEKDKRANLIDGLLGDPGNHGAAIGVTAQHDIGQLPIG